MNSWLRTPMQWASDTFKYKVHSVDLSQGSFLLLSQVKWDYCRMNHKIEVGKQIRTTNRRMKELKDTVYTCMFYLCMPTCKAYTKKCTYFMLVFWRPVRDKCVMKRKGPFQWSALEKQSFFFFLILLNKNCLCYSGTIYRAGSHLFLTLAKTVTLKKQKKIKVNIVILFQNISLTSDN